MSPRDEIGCPDYESSVDLMVREGRIGSADLVRLGEGAWGDGYIAGERSITARVAALRAERDALAALVAGAYEKCAKVAEDCACPLAREGRRSDRYGFCGHARCGHFHEAADAIRALARIDAASGRRG